ncbi:hypothetical protein D9611_000855 [Ephemerocybe angulata]|uniref:Uncharacterized protein n=2 Tax=Ephemerocybe angulata TaxID=980116 RepID=A0A8H5F6Z1_9AGAR|nr:hypothetical protein D9611_000855 [Tulosesus angulatus]KAF6749612.1 hypothetical protein DFP72DRAFT_913073 [Tulosesus angulatus]
MLALRRTAVVAASSRRAAVGAVRMYTVPGRAEGSVAQSKGFSKKEKAHEDQYIHQHEQDQIRKLRDEVAKKQAELEKLEKNAEKKQ